MASGNRTRIEGWAILLGVGGITALAISILTIGVGAAAGAVSANVGTALLILIPIMLIERRLEDWVHSIRTDADATRESVDRLAEEVEQVRGAVTSLQGLSSVTHETVTEASESELSPLQRFRDDVSVERLQDLLTTAREIRAISTHGLRVRFSGEDFALRVGAHSTAASLAAAASTFTRQSLGLWIEIESMTGRHLDSVRWRSEETAQQFGRTLSTQLKRHRLYPGDERFSTGLAETFENLIEVVQYSIDVVNSRIPGMRELGPVIQRVGPQWLITDDGLESADPYLYTVGWPSNKPGMHDHMREKAWLDYDEFWEAWEIASGLENHGTIQQVEH